MFAKPSTLSSNASVFQPQGGAAEYQYYSCQNSYGSYGYGYEQDYCNHYSTFACPQKQEVLNLDDFSDLSDSDEESAPKAISPKMKDAPTEIETEAETAEPFEEPSPGATTKSFDFKADSVETLSSALSTASPEPENEESSEETIAYSVSLLLNLRASVSMEESTVLYRTMTVEEEKPFEPPRAEPKAPKETRLRKKPSKLEASENSWAAQQRRAKHTESYDSTEQVARNIKSILNKLTLEKFGSLSQQLLTCGISSSEHLVVLIHEVFEKATLQHHFIDMYADLCVLLHEHYTAKPLQREDGKTFTFKKLLLDQCQSSFERLLTPPLLDDLPQEEKTVAEMSYKTHMLGNIKLVGGLLARGMLASKVGIAILEELLSNPTPEALESVAALLTSLGAVADQPAWPQYEALKGIFQEINVIVKSKSCPTRERCLLKDLLDLRQSGWVDRRPKKMEKAMTLAEVAESRDAKTPKTPSFVRKPVQFDQEKFRSAVKRLLREIQTAPMHEALEGLKGVTLPPASKQPLELAEILCQVVQEKASVRALGFKALSHIASDWHSEALAQGVKLFILDMASDVALDVPNLSQILEEFQKLLHSMGMSPAAQQALKGFQAK